MTIVLPKPLSYKDADLRDFAFMPLDVVRLRDSDLASQETPEACWSAVLLWCASWHQVPAGSLPDDDRTLSSLAGFGRVVAEWMKIKPGAMRGWVKCSDGRLYHPVIAEKANESWRSKVTYRWKKECDRIRKANKQREAENLDLLPYPVEPIFDDTEITVIPAEQIVIPPEAAQGTKETEPTPKETKQAVGGNPAEKALKGQVKGQGEVSLFERFYKAYPRHEAKRKAEHAFYKLRVDEPLLQIMLAAIARAKKSDAWRDKKYIPLPGSWLNGERWTDEPLDDAKAARPKPWERP